MNITPPLMPVVVIRRGQARGVWRNRKAQQEGRKDDEDEHGHE